MRRLILFLIAAVLLAAPALADTLLLRPARVFDGTATHEGWSVLVSGHAKLVDDPAELQRAANLGIEPWPGGPREALMQIETETITGRRIRQTSDA